MADDAAFTGSIPQLYESCLVPCLFDPYARHVAGMAARLAPGATLEVAAGTGAVTRYLVESLPAGSLTATDLNQAMIDVADARTGGRAKCLAASAQDLPFGDASFDLVLVQFGVMFFPDRIAAHREARRVLRDGGDYLFAVWSSLPDNPASEAIHKAVRDACPSPQPGFLGRVPFAYHDRGVIEAELREGGFDAVSIERVDLPHPPGSLAGLARGLCLGSPLSGELTVHSPDVQQAALAAAEAAVEALCNAGPAPGMSALVVTASA